MLKNELLNIYTPNRSLWNSFKRIPIKSLGIPIQKLNGILNKIRIRSNEFTSSSLSSSFTVYTNLKYFSSGRSCISSSTTVQQVLIYVFSIFHLDYFFVCFRCSVPYPQHYPLVPSFSHLFYQVWFPALFTKVLSSNSTYFQ